MPSCGTWESEALRSNVSTSSCCTSRYRSTGCQLQDLTFEAPNVSKETNIYFTVIGWLSFQIHTQKFHTTLLRFDLRTSFVFGPSDSKVVHSRYLQQIPSLLFEATDNAISAFLTHAVGCQVSRCRFQLRFPGSFQGSVVLLTSFDVPECLYLCAFCRRSAVNSVPPYFLAWVRFLYPWKACREKEIILDSMLRMLRMLRFWTQTAMLVFCPFAWGVGGWRPHCLFEVFDAPSVLRDC